MKASIHFTCAISSYATALYLMFGVNYLVHIVCSFLEYNFIKVVLDRSFVQKRTVNILLTFEIKHHLENSAASGSENASACMHAQMDGQVKNVKANSLHHARHDKTVLSVSCPLWRCELDSRQLKTVADRKFEV